MKYPKTFTLMLLSGLLFFTGHISAQQTDRFILRDGSSRKGTLQGYSVTHYLVKAGQRNVRIPRKQVENIQYWDSTNNLVEIEKAFQEERYERTVNLGEKVKQEIQEGDLREVHRPRIVYYLSASYFRTGQFKQALNEVKPVLNENPNQIWFDRMARFRLLSRTYQVYDPEKNVSEETYEEISDLGNKLIDLCKNKTDAPRKMVERMRLLRVQALEELGEGRLSITQVRYENLRDLETAEFRKRAMVGELRCQIRMGNKLQSVVETYEEKLKDASGDPLLTSGKLNAEGARFFENWTQDQGEPSILRDSVVSFIRAHVLYNTSTEYHSIQQRQSMYNAVRVFNTLAENVSDETKMTFFQNQADQTLTELTHRYSHTPEVRKADLKWGK